MKRNIYILFAISLLIRMLPLHSANSDTEHLSTLKRLIDSNIAYDSLAPMDSVIVWGQQISPILEKENTSGTDDCKRRSQKTKHQSYRK